MQNISQRASDTFPDKASENTNVKPVAEIEGAIRDFVRHDVGHSRRAPKDVVDITASVESLVQRTVSLGELQNVIRELQRLHDFLADEGERLQEEISEYARLSKSTMSSTRLIADNMLHWKKAAADDPL